MTIPPRTIGSRLGRRRARTAAQLKGSLDADDVTLPDEIRDALDDVSAPKSGYPETQRR